MIIINKKRKNIIVNKEITIYNELLIEFNQEQLKQISNCNYIEYNIIKNIIINIPENIKKIIFNGWFNIDIQNYLHSTINLLSFGFSYNLPIDNLPSKLNKLILGSSFNQNVSNLPLELKMIIFGNNFNQQIDMLPESITYIYLCGDFNHSVNNLPSKLEKITLIGTAFNRSIDSLPDSVKILVLNCHYDFEINKLPQKLILINFPKNKKCAIDFDKLKKITNAEIKHKID